MSGFYSEARLHPIVLFSSREQKDAITNLSKLSSLTSDFKAFSLFIGNFWIEKGFADVWTSFTKRAKTCKHPAEVFGRKVLTSAFPKDGTKRAAFY